MSNKICPNCGAENYVESKFCFKCAADIKDVEIKKDIKLADNEKFCSNCNAVNNINAKFCFNCAAEFKEEEPKEEIILAENEKLCSNCNAVNNINAKFCFNCAEPFYEINSKELDSEQIGDMQSAITEQNIQDENLQNNSSTAQKKTPKFAVIITLATVVIAVVLIVIVAVMFFGNGTQKPTKTATKATVSSTVAPTTQAATQETTIAPTTAKPTEAPNLTADDLYGYYVDEGYYIKISKDTYESKSVENGFVIANEKINKIDVEPSDDGKTKYTIKFDSDNLDDMIFYTNENKEVIDGYGEIIPKVSEEEYNSVTYAEPVTESNYNNDIYLAYYTAINSDDTLYYYLFDIDKDGTDELILEIGEYTYNHHYKFYTYKNGIVFLGTGVTGSANIYESYDNKLKAFFAKQGNYAFGEISIVNNSIQENWLEEQFAYEDYPAIDGTYLTGSEPDNLNDLTNKFLK